MHKLNLSCIAFRNSKSNEEGSQPDVFGMGTVSQIFAKPMLPDAVLRERLETLGDTPLRALFDRRFIVSSTPLPLVPTETLMGSLHAVSEDVKYFA